MPKLKFAIPKRALNFGLVAALIISLTATVFLASNFLIIQHPTPGVG